MWTSLVRTHSVSKPLPCQGDIYQPGTSVCSLPSYCYIKNVQIVAASHLSYYLCELGIWEQHCCLCKDLLAFAALSTAETERPTPKLELAINTNNPLGHFLLLICILSFHQKI